MRQGKLEHAYCTETRPYNQGARLTAYELFHDGLPSTLICDSAAASLMSLGQVWTCEGVDVRRLSSLLNCSRPNAFCCAGGRTNGYGCPKVWTWARFTHLDTLPAWIHVYAAMAGCVTPECVAGVGCGWISRRGKGNTIFYDEVEYGLDLDMWGI